MAVREKTEFQPNNVYFITFTICQWQRIIITSKYFDIFYNWFDHQKQNYGNKIHGYVIMPNHFHGLIHITDRSPPISKLIQNAKRFMAYRIIQLLTEDGDHRTLDVFKDHARTNEGAKHKVFESRYDSKIIDEEKLYHQKLEYIHNNPCNKGWSLAPSPELYPHSSASNYHSGTGFYPVDVLT
jgi:REP element-mobilizing transposase RayT